MSTCVYPHGSYLTKKALWNMRSSIIKADIKEWVLKLIIFLQISSKWGPGKVKTTTHKGNNRGKGFGVNSYPVSHQRVPGHLNAVRTLAHGKSIEQSSHFLKHRNLKLHRKPGFRHSCGHSTAFLMLEPDIY